MSKCSTLQRSVKPAAKLEESSADYELNLDAELKKSDEKYDVQTEKLAINLAKHPDILNGVTLTDEIMNKFAYLNAKDVMVQTEPPADKSEKKSYGCTGEENVERLSSVELVEGMLGSRWKFQKIKDNHWAEIYRELSKHTEQKSADSVDLKVATVPSDDVPKYIEIEKADKIDPARVDTRPDNTDVYEKFHEQSRLDERRRLRSEMRGILAGPPIVAVARPTPSIEDAMDMMRRISRFTEIKGINVLSTTDEVKISERESQVCE
ncbi:hypothetical protein ACOME3_009155 [Neoechinorhynchus agilis]